MEEKVLFRPAQTGRAVEDIAIQIEAAITSGDIKTGERLPSERQLQLLFKTGRGVVREALSTLKQKDLIEIKKGAKGGAFAKHPDTAKISESLALFLTQQSIDPESIIEFRETLDRTITILAITRGSKEEKDLLLAKAERFRNYASSAEYEPARIGEMDRELNTILAHLTGNPVFQWVMDALQLGFSSYDYALYEDAEYRIRTATNWADTSREIAAGEPVRALSFIANHYSLLRKCVKERSESIADRELDFSEISPEEEGISSPEEI